MTATAMAVLGAVHSDGEIEIGGHAATVTVFGLTINLDVVWATLFAAAVVLTLGFLMRARATDGVPGKLQLFWEVLVEQVQDLTDSAIGVAQGRRFVPLAVTIFIFLLVCNWMEVIPSGHNPEWLPPPTADVNLPAGHGADRDLHRAPQLVQGPRVPRATSTTTSRRTRCCCRSTSSRRSPSRSR